MIAIVGLLRAVVDGGLPLGIEAIYDGATAGVIFWLLRRLYYTIRKIQGLGLGDVKFLAAAGIWIGIKTMPMLLLVAAVSALAYAGLMQLTGRQFTGQTSIAFGPFLALGLILTSALQELTTLFG